MDIAIYADKIITDAAVFDDFAVAQDFLTMGVWPGADGVVELAEGYGIGDGYDPETGEWTHIATAAPEEPDTDEGGDTGDEIDPAPTTEERLTTLETDVAAIEAAIERGLAL